MKKDEDFGEWYNDIVERANLSDKRYPIKGMNVWTPYGWRIMRQIDQFIREELDATDHDEVCFPLLIPETEFQKEKDHIKGFDAEVFWVTHAGLNELDVRMVMRPTSETAMYPMFALWVRSHTDLPLKTYQLVNTFRYETKMTRPFIRVREIHFFESHTCHVDYDDAERQVDEDFSILENLMDRLCLPYLLLKRTDWDKFPGAYYTVGIDTYMPNGRTLQLGSIHHYRDNFSKPYEIRYENAEGEWEYVHQTTYGMSERLVGAVVGVHGDDKGLVLPPDVAPFQVVIVPILKKEHYDEINKAAADLLSQLKKAGIRAHLDDRDDRPGSKFFDWEIKGVSLRLELGLHDIQNDVVTYARRDTGDKGSFPPTETVTSVTSILASIKADMRARATESMNSGIVIIDSMENIPESIVKFGWCGDEACGHALEERTELNILGTPRNDETFQGRCLVCSRETSTVAYAARTM